MPAALAAGLVALAGIAPRLTSSPPPRRQRRQPDLRRRDRPGTSGKIQLSTLGEMASSAIEGEPGGNQSDLGLFALKNDSDADRSPLLRCSSLAGPGVVWPRLGPSAAALTPSAGIRPVSSDREADCPSHPRLRRHAPCRRAQRRRCLGQVPLKPDAYRDRRQLFTPFGRWCSARLAAVFPS